MNWSNHQEGRQKEELRAFELIRTPRSWLSSPMRGRNSGVVHSRKQHAGKEIGQRPIYSAKSFNFGVIAQQDSDREVGVAQLESGRRDCSFGPVCLGNLSRRKGRAYKVCQGSLVSGILYDAGYNQSFRTLLIHALGPFNKSRIFCWPSHFIVPCVLLE